MKRRRDTSGLLPWQKWNLLLPAGAVLLVLLLAEGLLRLFGITYPNFFQPDPVLGIAHRPGAEGRYRMEGESLVRINRRGLRDREHELEKPEGVFRIAVLGDSYAEAFQVPREESFPAVLERELQNCPALEKKRAEVINFGVSSFGTGQELLMLRKEVWNHSPDAVLLAFVTANDIADNSRLLKKRDYVPYFVYQGNKLTLDRTFLESVPYQRREGFWGRCYYGLINHSRIMQLVNILRFQRRGAGEGYLEPFLYEEVYLPPRDRVWKEAWRVTEGLLREMDREARSRGVLFFLVILTNSIQVHPDPSVSRRLEAKLGVGDLLYPDRRLEDFAGDNGIPVLSLAGSFQDHARREKVFLHGFSENRGKGHWNEEGHRLAGEMIARWLCPQLHSPRRDGDRKDN